MSLPAKILIVDDEELIRLNLRALLEDLGYRVSEASDGRDGLDAFEREQPDLVLADLMMPVIDGLSMIAGLREKSPETPVIVISGTGAVRSAVDSIRLGAWDYVTKPVADVDTLDIVIRRTLEKARLVKENRIYRENLEKSADALRASEERYALAVQGSNDGIWDIDMATGKAYHSPRWNSITGIEENELPASFKEWENRVHPDDHRMVMETHNAYLEGRIPALEIEYRLRHMDGSYRWVLSRGACLRDSQGRPYRMAGSLTDITERKKLEQQLRQSQNTESIGILAGGVAHEFNNLLTAISGYGQILQERIPVDDELSQESICNVLKAAERAAELTRSLLAFSRKQSIRPEPVRLDTIVEGIEKLIRQVVGAKIGLRVILSGENLRVKADLGQMELVLMNLATNARDAMSGGGRLIITTGRAVVEEGSEAGFDLPAPGKYGLISFSDNGTGIDRESLGKIFEPFYTTKELGKGTGLGLSLVHGIIKQHNGSILCSSEVGKGTTFNIYLPLIEGDASGEKAKIPVPHAPGIETLLLVEDEEIVRTFTKRMLERAGYSVIVADNGEDAVARFRERGDISLVLSDVMMPGKTGLEALSEIRKIKPGVKLMFISGYTADIMRERGVFEEGADFIMKPFKKSELLRKVRQILDS